MTEIPLADRIEAWRHTAECSPSPAQRAQAREELVAVGEDVSDLRDDLTDDEKVAGNIGRRVHDLREAAGMSQEQLAEKIAEFYDEYLDALESVFEIVQARRARFTAGRAVAVMAGIHPSNAEEVALDLAISRVEALRS